MDNQFNTLMRSYHDNFLQYKLTGAQKYKVAYEAAQKGLDSIIVSRNQSVESDAKNIQNSLGADSANKMKDIKSQSIHLGHELLEERDEEVAAKLRTVSTPSAAPVSLTTQYIILGVLVTTIAGLSFL
jgi:hypothetical protein